MKQPVEEFCHEMLTPNNLMKIALYICANKFIWSDYKECLFKGKLFSKTAKTLLSILLQDQKLCHKYKKDLWLYITNIDLNEKKLIFASIQHKINESENHNKKQIIAVKQSVAIIEEQLEKANKEISKEKNDNNKKDLRIKKLNEENENYKAEIIKLKRQHLIEINEYESELKFHKRSKEELYNSINTKKE